MFFVIGTNILYASQTPAMPYSCGQTQYPQGILCTDFFNA